MDFMIVFLMIFGTLTTISFVGQMILLCAEISNGSYKKRSEIYIMFIPWGLAVMGLIKELRRLEK